MSSPSKRIALFMVLCALLLTTSWVLAQETQRSLTPGVVVTGSVGGEDLAQVYNFAGTSGQIIKLSVTGSSGLALLLTDASGNAVAQAVGTSGTAALADVELPVDGIYYVTVFPLGVGVNAINFQLSLAVGAETALTPSVTPEPALEPTAETAAAPPTATIQPTPELSDRFVLPGEVLTATGLQITLRWSTIANLDLEVRDPVGGSLFFRTPSVASGGAFGVNANSVCNNRTEAAVETASWQPGVVPTGSYEILVYYQPLTDCPTTDPAGFTIEVVLDGVPLPQVTGSLLPNQIYLSSFRVNANGTAAAGASGVKVDPPTVRAADLTRKPLPIQRDVLAVGDLTSQRFYDTYIYTAQPNEVISIALNATSGSLDPLLLVLDPNGNLIAFNDDRGEGITDSLISNLTLILGGQYTIVASRYGQALGGTEGGYTLNVTGPSVDANTLLNLADLPAGSVQVVLQWSTGADMRLLVRDPQGVTVFDDVPLVASGARLLNNGNLNCRTSAVSPLSYVYWPEIRLPAAGPYEIEVRYQNACNDVRPVVFTLTVIAQGQAVLSQTQQLIENERYVTSFNIDLNGAVVGGDGGTFGTSQRPDATSLLADLPPLIESARVIANSESVTGSIRLNKKFDVYVFDGRAGDLVTIGMEGLSGTLDPTLFLLDASGVQIAQNDDASRETTNALINEFTLPDDGRYIIIATHFGARYGVTAGDYRLTLRLN